MKVRDLMTRRVVAVDPGMSLREAARLLSEHRVAFAPVVANRCVVGAIEARDVPWYADCDDAGDATDPDGPDGADARELTVGDVMQRFEVPRLAPDDDVSAAAARLALAGTRRGVVFDNSRLVGLLSTTDIVRWLDEGASETLGDEWEIVAFADWADAPSPENGLTSRTPADSSWSMAGASSV